MRTNAIYMTGWIVLGLFGLVTAAAAQTESAEPVASGERMVHGHVMEAGTDRTVPLANVRVAGTSRGTAADAAGHFMLYLQPNDTELIVSAVGYLPARVAIEAEHVTVYLKSQEATLEAVLVSGERTVAGDPSAPARTPATTDDLLTRLPGLSLVQRANFAWEPVVRGYRGGQIALTVDGMPVYGACVDKMDPASSYVEPENLAAVEVSKGAADLTRGSQIGGTVNLVTERPEFDAPVSVSAETGIESQGAARRVRGTISTGGSRWAVRASGSYRGAGDYAPGGGDPIPTSGYEKRNLAGTASLGLAEGHTLTAQLITDDAWLVGYPALLMDATLAQARIASVDYEGRTPGLDRLRLRIYRNRVDHTMDDRFRDVMERPVMRGMFMPMAGYTDVWGTRTDLERRIGETSVSMSGDVHRLQQFGDMWMYSLFPGIRDMYLLNVGDARALNAGLSLNVSRPVGERWMVSASARMDGSRRNTHRDEIRSIFESRYGITDLARSLLIPSASLTATYNLAAQTQLLVSVADAGRLPTI
ncbi:MAG: TonB-dependent receptor, partial [Bacteroidota bacterium]